MNTNKRKILLGITGSIAAYKAPLLVRQLVEKNYEVRAVLTKSARAFVTPLTLQTLSSFPVHEELVDEQAEAAMGHIELARWADVILVAPASANFIAKLTAGLADDLLNAVCLATTAPIMIAPAMNQQMWLNTVTQKNIFELKERGIPILGPGEGIQACGENGPGRMLEPQDIIEHLESYFIEPLFRNLRILISAGPTHETIDPVRYIANRSSGKMGYALAKAAKLMGATVTLVSGPASLEIPKVDKFIKITSAHDMQNAIHDEITNHDIFISAAAIADYTVASPASHKIKRSESISLTLVPTEDILLSLRTLENKPFLVGFAAETENLVNNARKKLFKKEVDMIIANDISQPGIGFESDFNEVTVITKQSEINIPTCNKGKLALQLLNIIYLQYAEQL